MISPKEEHFRDLKRQLQRDLNVAVFLGLSEKDWRDNVQKAANELMIERAQFSQINLKQNSGKRRVA